MNSSIEKKMTIGLVLPALPAYSETFFRNKIDGLQERGFKLILFVGGLRVNTKEDWHVVYAPQFTSGNLVTRCRHFLKALGACIFLCPRRSIKLFFAVLKDHGSIPGAAKVVLLNSHILGHRLDWLHFGFATTAIGRERLAGVMGARMAVSLRGFDISVYPLKHPGCYERLWPRLDKVHSISNSLIELAKLQGMSSTQNWTRITPATNVKSELPFDSALVLEKLKILTVARLHWIKGLDYSLHAMRHLKEWGIPFEYVIVGTGPERERLYFTRTQLRLEEEVVFLGKVAYERIPSLLIASDVYLQPSLMEGFCNAALEAQAMGRLVVVSDVGGLRENVVDGETGWRVPSRDPLAMANKLKEIYHLTIDDRNLVCRRASQRVRSSFNIEKQMEAFAEFYLQ